MSTPPIALVTGSTDGLGRAVARTLAARGFMVWVHGLRPARAHAMAYDREARRRLADLSAALGEGGL